MCDKNPNEVTITYDLVTFHSNHSVDLILTAIKSNQWKMIVHTVRQLVSAGNKEAANELKKHLPAVTFSCTYHPRRSHKNVTGYTGIVVLDADSLSDMELVRLVAMLPSCPHVYAFFISPSGRGIKILIKTNGKQANHDVTYKYVLTYFSRFLKVTFDACTSDIVRLCFLSHDPNAFINKEAMTFDVTIPRFLPAAPQPLEGGLSSAAKFRKSSFELSPSFGGVGEAAYIFRKCVRFTNRKRQFTEGNRNNFVFLLSCYCRMNGLDREDALNEIIQHYNYSQREIQSAVKSAYRYK